MGLFSVNGFTILECGSCKTKNRIPDPPRLNGVYRCQSCTAIIYEPHAPRPEARKTISESQIRIQAAKEVLLLCFVILFFGGFLVFLFILNISTHGPLLAAGVFAGLFALLYNWKLKRVESFFADIKKVRGLIRDNQPVRAQAESRGLTPPLGIFRDLLSELKGEVEQALEKHKEEQRLLDEQKERKKREELFNNIRSKDILDSISPQEFESVVLEAFARLGYQASHTPWSGDEGIDGILVKAGKKTAVQCKKHKNTVGQPYLRDFLGAMVHAKCEEGIFVTTSEFSDGARALAKANKIKLIDGSQVIDLLRRTITEDFVLNGSLVKFPPKVEDKVCPRCGGRLRKRLGINGFFWGCSNFPRCRYTENANHLFQRRLLFRA